MGTTTDLASTDALLSRDAKGIGFTPTFAMALDYVPGGRAFVFEFVPDDAERRALASGARLRVQVLGTIPVPIRVGVATGLKADMPDMIDAARLHRIVARLKFADDLDADERVKSSREVIAIVVEELCR